MSCWTLKISVVFAALNENEASCFLSTSLFHLHCLHHSLLRTFCPIRTQLALFLHCGERESELRTFPIAVECSTLLLQNINRMKCYCLSYVYFVCASIAKQLRLCAGIWVNCETRSLIESSTSGTDKKQNGRLPPTYLAPSHFGKVAF